MKIYVCCKPKTESISSRALGGKILYNVVLKESEKSCTCSDFAKNAKKDSEFKCNHILAVFNCVTSYAKSAYRTSKDTGRNSRKCSQADLNIIRFNCKSF